MMPREAPQQAQARLCMEVCRTCHEVCLSMAMVHCLELGGRHIEPEHFRLMMSCAWLCDTMADFIASQSPFAEQLARLCAEVCEACADSCEEVGQMADCVQACRQVVQQCRHVSGGAMPMEG